jgi:hypothetical protein
MNVRKVIHELYRQENRPVTPEEFWAAGGCLAFPGKVEKAITGTDSTEWARSQFTTETEAKRRMVEHGCKGLADIAGRLKQEIPVAQARAGDWAVVRNPDETEGLGVVIGAQIVVPTPQGHGIVPLLSASSAYRVA